MAYEPQSADADQDYQHCVNKQLQIPHQAASSKHLWTRPVYYLFPSLLEDYSLPLKRRLINISNRVDLTSCSKDRHESFCMN